MNWLAQPQSGQNAFGTIQEQWNPPSFEELTVIFQQASRKYAELWKVCQGTSVWATSLKQPALKSHCVNLFLQVVLIKRALILSYLLLSSFPRGNAAPSVFISKPAVCVTDEWSAETDKTFERTDSKVAVPLCMCLHLINCPYVFTSNLDHMTLSRHPKGMQHR